MYGMNMYNPYHYGQPNVGMNAPVQTPMLPPQQVIQVNGKASIDTLQLAPNSSILAMDTSAPIVWLCVSDGIGKVTSTPYDISEHKDAPTADEINLEQRLTALETTVAEMGERINESNVNKYKQKQGVTADKHYKDIGQSSNDA